MQEYDTDSYVSEDLSDDENEFTLFSVAYRQVEVARQSCPATRFNNLL